jgi:hypothetical protein
MNAFETLDLERLGALHGEGALHETSPTREHLSTQTTKNKS